MKYRRLGRTGMRVSVVGIGTWQFGGEWGKDFEQHEVDAMFRRGAELGINLIDTAECYGDHTSEAFIGRAIEGQRDQWIVATKIGHKFHAPFKRTDERSADDAVKQLEDSLRALRTDHVDLLQYHSVRDSEFDDAALRSAMIRLKKQGKVRHLGASISKNDNTHQVENAPASEVEAIQVVYNRLDRAPEEKVLPLCEQLDLGVLGRVPLASGLLSGKYKPGHAFGEGDVRKVWGNREEQDRKLREVEEIERNEVPAGTPVARWALAWVLRHAAVSCVIPGCKNVKQVEQNAAAADLVAGGHGQDRDLAGGVGEAARG